MKNLKHRNLRYIYLIPFLLFLACAGTTAPVSLVIESPAVDLENTPVFVEVPAGKIKNSPVCMTGDSKSFPAQTEKLDNGNVRVWWLASQEAGTTVRYELSNDKDCNSPQFSWRNAGGRSDRLYYNDKPVISYEHPVFDPLDEGTIKPFHNVFSPDGSRQITKGTGGLYPHHRGIYLGYNHIFVNDKTERADRIDIWHARNGEHSEHEEVIAKFEGPVMGGHSVRIAWRDREDQPFISEKRDIRVFKLDDENLIIDVTSELTSLKDKVVLGGDRHHAGLQFRASQHVADNPEASRFIRPEPWANVPADSEIADENITGFPWNALYFQMEGQSYTVAYLSHPENPDGGEMSERLYGRFGEFIPYELGLNESLVLKYRFLIKSGSPMSRAEIQKQHDSWVKDLSIKTN